MDKQLPVSVWPEWKIIEKIGEGSFGKVYKAQRSEQGTTFYSAIKVISIPSSQSELNSVRSESGNDQSAREYFHSLVEECIQEVSTMEYFRGNSHVVSVEDYKVVEYLDDIGWDIYIRMEYLTSFLDYCAGKQLSEEEVIQLGIDLCKALEYCQKQNIIHRDIKPENIFVSRFGEFKLGDFGIARELERSMSALSKKGTFSYMAPEMYKGESYDSRADIYSLGIVLYKLRNRNRLPFLNLEKQLITYRDKENALTRRMSGEPLPNPGDASLGFAQVVLKACEYHREDRYEDAAEFRKALEGLKYNRVPVEAETMTSQPIAETEMERTVKVKKAEHAAQGKSLSENAVPVNAALVKSASKSVSMKAESGNTASVKSAPAKDPASKASNASKALKAETAKRDNAKAARAEEAKIRQLEAEYEEIQKQRAELERNAKAAAIIKERKRKREAAKTGPLIAAVIIMAIAVCLVSAMFLKLLFEENESSTNIPIQVETPVSKELAEALEEINDHTSEIAQNLNQYNWIGSEDEGKISYLNQDGAVRKVLVYPKVSAEGYYEEYYYWDDKLIFAYIWADQNTLPYLKEGQQKVNLYYYKDGELIRWIDENNYYHDGETENEEYRNRGQKYWDQAVVYKNLLNA